MRNSNLMRSLHAPPIRIVYDDNNKSGHGRKKQIKLLIYPQRACPLSLIRHWWCANKCISYIYAFVLSPSLTPRIKMLMYGWAQGVFLALALQGGHGCGRVPAKSKFHAQSRLSDAPAKAEHSKSRMARDHCLLGDGVSS